MTFTDRIWRLNSLQNSEISGRDFKPLNPNIMKFQKTILIITSMTIGIIVTSCEDREIFIEAENHMLSEDADYLQRKDSADSKEIIVKDPPPKDRDNWKVSP